MFSNKKLKIYPFFRYYELYSTLLPEKDKIPDEPGCTEVNRVHPFLPEMLWYADCSAYQSGLLPDLLPRLLHPP